MIYSEDRLLVAKSAERNAKTAQTKAVQKAVQANDPKKSVPEKLSRTSRSLKRSLVRAGGEDAADEETKEPLVKRRKAAAHQQPETAKGEAIKECIADIKDAEEDQPDTKDGQEHQPATGDGPLNANAGKDGCTTGRSSKVLGLGDLLGFLSSKSF